MQPAPTSDFLTTFKTWYKITGLFIWGLGIASGAGLVLLIERWPESPGRLPLAAFLLLWLIWNFPLNFPRPTESPGLEGLAWFAFCLMLLALYLVREHEWVPPVVGATNAASFWTLGKLRQRPVLIAISGCLLGAVASFPIPWPSEQRSLFVL